VANPAEACSETVGSAGVYLRKATTPPARRRRRATLHHPEVAPATELLRYRERLAVAHVPIRLLAVVRGATGTG